MLCDCKVSFILIIILIITIILIKITIINIIVIITITIHILMIKPQVDYLVRARQLALTGHYPHLTDLHQVAATWLPVATLLSKL